jgi:hypothetical protein
MIILMIKYYIPKTRHRQMNDNMFHKNLEKIEKVS